MFFSSEQQRFSDLKVHVVLLGICSSADSGSEGLGWSLSVCASNKLLVHKLHFEEQRCRKHLILILCLKSFCSFPWEKKRLLSGSKLKWNISGQLYFLPSLCDCIYRFPQLPKWISTVRDLGQYLRVFKQWSYPTGLSYTAFDLEKLLLLLLC